ncbi:MAG: magnesium chelatase domain-containing protein [Opitutales bacterium]
MLAVSSSSALQGVAAASVTVEVNTGERGDLKYVLVGLPDVAVKESIDRITSAISNAGFSLPSTRTTINLAPGDLRKEGPSYDLPIALGMLGATGQMKTDRFGEYLVAGELGLSGKTRPVRGGLAMALLARRQGKRGVLLPLESAEEACLVEGNESIPIESLDEAVRFLEGERSIEPLSPSRSPYVRPIQNETEVDFTEVKGQTNLRRALEVAVAGGHNALMMCSFRQV